AVGAFLVEFFRKHVEIDILHPQLAKIPVEHGLAGGDVLVLILLAKPLLHLGAGAGGVQITGGGGEPVAARGFLLAGDDLDLIRGVPNGAKGRDPAVDLAAPATVADLGVDTVGKIQRRRYRRQVHHVALRGKDVDAVRGALVLEQVLDILVTDFVVPFQHLAQPGDLGFVALGGGYRVAALVLPVGADAEFRLLVHLEGADLDFDDAVARPDHRGVQRAIAVFLGGGDVVVELVGNVAPFAVDDAEQGVAISHGGHQYPHRADIVDLGETDVLALHLSPDAVDMLGAPRYVPDDANPIQLRLQGIHQFLDVMLPVGSPLRQQLGDALVLHRLQVAKGEVLQLPLEVADTEAMGEGGVDVEDFPGDPQLALLGRGLDAANGAGALGQLDQRHPHVVDDGHQHLTHLGGLALGVEAEHLPLGIVAQGRDHRHAQHAADQFGNLAAKVLFHPLDGQAAFPDGAIEHRCHEAFVRKAEFGKNFGHFQAGEKAADGGIPAAPLAEVALLDLVGEFTGVQQHRFQLGRQARFLGDSPRPPPHVHLVAEVNVVHFPRFNHEACSPEITRRVADQRS